MTFEEIDQKIVQLSNDFEAISSITTNDFKGIGEKTYARVLDDLRDSYRASALCSFSSAGSGVPQFTEDTNIIRIDFDAIGKLQNIIFDALKTHDDSIKEMKTSVTAMEWEGEDKNAAINLWNTITGDTSAVQHISNGIDKYYNVLYNTCAYYETAQSKSAETELRNPIQIQTQKLRDIAAYLKAADAITNLIKIEAATTLAELTILTVGMPPLAIGSEEKMIRLGVIVALNNGELSKIGNSMINTAAAFEEADANTETMRQKDLVEYYCNSSISDQDTNSVKDGLQNKAIEHFVDLAMEYVGLRETGENGTKFNEWYYDNPNTRAPWCATFVSYIAAQAGLKPTDQDGNVMKGEKGEGLSYQGCDDGQNRYRDVGRLNTVESGYEPKKGDVFFQGGKHTGIVVAYDPITKIVYTVEGNYGDKVSLVKRDINSFTAFGSNGGTSYGSIPSNADEYEGGGKSTT